MKEIQRVVMVALDDINVRLSELSTASENPMRQSRFIQIIAEVKQLSSTISVAVIERSNLDPEHHAQAWHQLEQELFATRDEFFKTNNINIFQNRFNDVQALASALPGGHTTTGPRGGYKPRKTGNPDTPTT